MKTRKKRIKYIRISRRDLFKIAIATPMIMIFGPMCASAPSTNGEDCAFGPYGVCDYGAGDYGGVQG